MRLIDADALDLDREVELADDWKTAHEIANCVKYAPTVDAAPVAHGRWIENEGFDGDCYYTCSVCQCDWTTIDGTPTENNMRYCPECGAKMDLEERNE